MLKRIIKTVAVMTTGAAVTAPLSLNYENLAIHGGYDNVLTAIWGGITKFIDLVTYPDFAWLFWLGIGTAIGAVVNSRIRRIEETSRGRLGGPSFLYLRWEAKMIRLAIRMPVLRKLSADFDRDLADMNDILTGVHNMPALPATTFIDAEKLSQTSEYLRLVLPNLDSSHVDEARESAARYVARITQPP